jgi:uncharacterized protein YndB with AHSA1/START domain
MMRTVLLIAVANIAAASTSAELVATSDTGFVSRYVIETKASPDAVYALLGTPARWWAASHTYSGNAANLSLDPKAGGCFCETVPATNATIEHARVIYAEPGKKLRLSGALGPLQREAVTGILEFTIESRPGGGSTVTLTYVVGGYSRNALSVLAGPVDSVMGVQFAGLAKALAKQ